MSDNEEEFLSVNTSRSPSQLVRTYIMFLFMCQTLFRVSDTGMNILLLLFLAKFFSLIAAVTKLNFAGFIDQLPQTTTAAKKLTGNVVDNFSKYASCPKCHSICPLHTCSITSSDRTKLSRYCSHVEYPNHPHVVRRRLCNIPLMKVVHNYTASTAALLLQEIDQITARFTKFCSKM